MTQEDFPLGPNAEVPAPPVDALTIRWLRRCGRRLPTAGNLQNLLHYTFFHDIVLSSGS